MDINHLNKDVVYVNNQLVQQKNVVLQVNRHNIVILLLQCQLVDLLVRVDYQGKNEIFNN